MAKTLAQKIIDSHKVDDTPDEIGLRIDQTLTQDATGTMAYLEFEAIGIDNVKTELSVSYVDHNTLQTGFENADDHRFLHDIAARYGIYFSRPGNGICHQVHLERFGVPGKTLLGSDSHTPTGGGIGMLAIGAGGLDVAAAMAGRAAADQCKSDGDGCQGRSDISAAGLSPGACDGNGSAIEPWAAQGRYCRTINCE